MNGVTSALVAWPAAALLAGLLAAATGAVSLRTRGVYFIMITLAFAQMLFYIFISLRQYGGEDGLNLPGHSVLPGLDLGHDVSFYYVVLALFAVLMAVRSEEHTSELQSHLNLVCRLLLEKKK